MASAHDQVRKLLNLAADDGASEGEVENALRFAHNLMARHNITKEQLSKDEVEEREAMAASYTYHESSKSALWEGQLAMFLATFCGVQVYRVNGGSPRRTAAGCLIDGNASHVSCFRFYGGAEGVQLAIATYEDLRKTVITMARLRCGGVYRGAGRSYCEGFIKGLKSQLQKAIASTSESQELAVLSKEIATRNNAIGKAYMKKTHGIKLSGPTKRRAGQHHAAAHAQGRVDGRAATLEKSKRNQLN